MLQIQHKRLVLAAVLGTLLLLGPAAPTTAAPAPQADTPNPHFIYWANTHYRIESADGTRSLPIAEGYFPPEADTGVGVAFSPSGEWLVAEAVPEFIDTQPQLPANRLLLTNVYSGERIALPATAVLLTAYAWHPTEDLLLLQTIPPTDPTATPYTPAAERTLHIIDPAAGGVIAEWTFTVDTTGHERYTPVETRLGFAGPYAYVVFSYRLSDAPNDVREIRRIVFDTEAVLVDDVFVGTQFDVSSAEFFMRVAEDAIIFEDLAATASGQAGPTFSVAREPAAVVRHSFPPDGFGVLLQQNNRITWYDLTPLAAQSGRIDAVEVLADGVLTTFDDIYGAPHGDFDAGWSDSGNFKLLTDLGGPRGVVFDRRQGRAVALPEGVGGQAVGWQGDQVLLVAGREQESGIPPHTLSVLDAATLDFAQADTPLRPFSSVPALAADQRTVVVNEFGVRLLDTPSGAEQLRSPDSRSYFTGVFGEVFPHPELPYALLQTDGLVAGGGAIRWLSVHSLEGELQREIAHNAPVNAGLQRPALFWLPPQVDVTQLPAGDDRSPDFTHRLASYTTTHWSFDLAWNADGTALAAGRTPHFTTPVSRLALADGPQQGTLVPVELATDRSTESLYDTRLAFDAEGNVVLQAREAAPPRTDFVVLDSVETTFGERWLLVLDEPFSDIARVIRDPGLDLTNNPPEIVVLQPERRRFGGTGNFMVPTRGSFVAYGGQIYDTVLDYALVTLPYGEVQAMAFSPDGTLLAVSSGYDIDIWDVSATGLMPPRG